MQICLRSLLGLDPITRILSAEAEDGPAYTFSKDPSLESSPESSTGKENADSVKTSGNKLADTDNNTKNKDSADTKESGDKKSGTDTNSGNKKSGGKSSSGSTDQDSAKNTTADIKDRKEEEDKSEKENSGDGKSDKDKKDKSDSLTKTQKKYVKAWEEKHYRSFPLMSRLENAEIWYADYSSVPESPYRFTFWQYTSMGWVDGIPETETDLNLWFIKKD